MIPTMPNYVEQTPEGVWKVSGSRVTLDSIVAAYLSGLSAEGIQEAYPSLSRRRFTAAWRSTSDTAQNWMSIYNLNATILRHNARRWQ